MGAKASNKPETTTLHAFIPHNHFKMEGSQNMRCLFQDSDYLRKLEKMYIIVLLYRKARGNTFGSAGQKTYTI